MCPVVNRKYHCFLRIIQTAILRNDNECGSYGLRKDLEETSSRDAANQELFPGIRLYSSQLIFSTFECKSSYNPFCASRILNRRYEFRTKI